MPTSSEKITGITQQQQTSERFLLDKLLIPRAHFAEFIMVSLAASKSGKTSVIFIAKNVKINSEVYQQNVLANLLYEIENITDIYYFQQDGAPSGPSIILAAQ